MQVRRWPGEQRLFAVCLVLSLVLWVLLTVSVVGLLYGVMLAAFFFIMHLAFIAHVRGSAIRLGAGQLPDLDARIREIAATFGMTTVPEAYLMQSGGWLILRATLIPFLGTALSRAREYTCDRYGLVAAGTRRARCLGSRSSRQARPTPGRWTARHSWRSEPR